MLKRWTANFSPFTETFKCICLWVLLPDLPLKFWDPKVLKAIGDKVGDFVFFELKYLSWEVKQMAWILVDCDLLKGVPEAIEITSEKGVHI